MEATATIKLRRLAPGCYEDQDGRYQIDKVWSEAYGDSWYVSDRQEGYDNVFSADTLAEVRQWLANDRA